MSPGERLKEATERTLQLWIEAGTAEDRLREAYARSEAAWREWREAVTALGRLEGKTTPEPPHDWVWTPEWSWQPTGTWPPKQGS